jgi:hypothetical protein
MQLLEILTGDEAKWTANGREEVQEMAASIDADTDATTSDAPAEEAATETTIGSLK